MRLFLDSSALTKRYVSELGSDAVKGLIAPEAGNVILVAQITPVEVMSAVRRLERAGDISTHIASSLRLLIEREAAREYKVVRLTKSIVGRALDLLESHPLRAYDAVQLASALDVNARLVSANVPPITFVCADKLLIDTARKERLIVEEPA